MQAAVSSAVGSVLCAQVTEGSISSTAASSAPINHNTTATSAATTTTPDLATNESMTTANVVEIDVQNQLPEWDWDSFVNFDILASSTSAEEVPQPPVPPLKSLQNSNNNVHAAGVPKHTNRHQCSTNCAFDGIYLPTTTSNSGGTGFPYSLSARLPQGSLASSSAVFSRPSSSPVLDLHAAAAAAVSDEFLQQYHSSHVPLNPSSSHSSHSANNNNSDYSMIAHVGATAANLGWSHLTFDQGSLLTGSHDSTFSSTSAPLMMFDHDHFDGYDVRWGACGGGGGGLDWFGTQLCPTTASNFSPTSIDSSVHPPLIASSNESNSKTTATTSTHATLISVAVSSSTSSTVSVGSHSTAIDRQSQRALPDFTLDNILGMIRMRQIEPNKELE